MNHGPAIWYRTRKWVNVSGIGRRMQISEPVGGELLAWGTDHEEYDSGPGPYPAAVVRDTERGFVKVVPAGDVCFGAQPDFGD